MSVLIIATNRKARHNYHLIDKYEAGMVLLGSEVKALRESKGNIKEAYIRFMKKELYITGMHISEYSHSGYSVHEPTRERKLLLQKRELNILKKRVDEKGVTMVPLSIYFKNGYVKIEFAIAKGKKTWDKRQTLIKRDIERQTQRQFKGHKISL